MSDKRPVYNGYNEHYLCGKVLKDYFKNCYYTTGKHHSIVLGIRISDYLDLLNIDELKEYRIFVNDYFCRVMDAETDRLISFFGYHTPTSIRPYQIELPKTCPSCGASMKFKEGRFGEFLGCSRYPKCKHTVKIPVIENR